jgi:hypothetical protein
MSRHAAAVLTQGGPAHTLQRPLQAKSSAPCESRISSDDCARLSSAVRPKNRCTTIKFSGPNLAIRESVGPCGPIRRRIQPYDVKSRAQCGRQPLRPFFTADSPNRVPVISEQLRTVLEIVLTARPISDESARSIIGARYPFCHELVGRRACGVAERSLRALKSEVRRKDVRKLSVRAQPPLCRRHNRSIGSR